MRGTRVDERGFIVHEPPRVTVRMRPLRANMPWTKAEDQFLFRRLRELEVAGVDRPMSVISAEIGRSTLAVQARFQSLRVGIRLVQTGHDSWRC